MRGRRILIVEDDLDTLELLSGWAEGLGCTVQTSTSGEQALKLTTTFKPRVLVTDYLLEDDLTGVDVIVAARDRGLQMTCVLVTAVLDQALRESLHRINGVVILAKPVDLGRLARVILTS